MFGCPILGTPLFLLLPLLLLFVGSSTNLGAPHLDFEMREPRKLPRRCICSCFLSVIPEGNLLLNHPAARKSPVPQPTQRLILACGNPLRGDDGAAWHLAEQAQSIGLPNNVRLILQQQWTPELAEDIAQASAVLFVDCSIAAPPGSVTLQPVTPAQIQPSYLTHHLDAPTLLLLAQSLFGQTPTRADLLLIGAHSLDHTDQLSGAVQAALPQALNLLLTWAHEDR